MPKTNRNPRGRGDAANIVANIKRASEEAKKPATVTVVTQPVSKKLKPHEVVIEKGARLSRLYNNDGSISIYAAGVRVARLGGEDSDVDADEAAEKFARRWFGSGKPVLWGRSAYGHFWKNKKKAETAQPTA